jgi:ribosomal protein S18 acetylase RimI-like enzyme
MGTLTVERLGIGDYALIKPLLVDLHLAEQGHYEDHPQLSRWEIEDHLTTVPSSFRGENVIFAVRDDGGDVIGFSWIVLFDPGTGLEGEVAEVYVAAEHRGHGIGEVLMEQAVRLFRERGVTLGYVWTRPDNEAAVRLYRNSGFESSRQLVLTWYPT